MIIILLLLIIKNNKYINNNNTNKIVYTCKLYKVLKSSSPQYTSSHCIAFCSLFLIVK